MTTRLKCCVDREARTRGGCFRYKDKPMDNPAQENYKRTVMKAGCPGTSTGTATAHVGELARAERHVLAATDGAGRLGEPRHGAALRPSRAVTPCRGRR